MGWGRNRKEYEERAEDLQAGDTTVYETMMPDTCHYLSVKTHQM